MQPNGNYESNEINIAYTRQTHASEGIDCVSIGRMVSPPVYRSTKIQIEFWEYLERERELVKAADIVQIRNTSEADAINCQIYLHKPPFRLRIVHWTIKMKFNFFAIIAEIFFQSIHVPIVVFSGMCCMDRIDCNVNPDFKLKPD